MRIGGVFAVLPGCVRTNSYRDLEVLKKTFYEHAFAYYVMQTYNYIYIYYSIITPITVYKYVGFQYHHSLPNGNWQEG